MPFESSLKLFNNGLNKTQYPFSVSLKLYNYKIIRNIFSSLNLYLLGKFRMLRV